MWNLLMYIHDGPQNFGLLYQQRARKYNHEISRYFLVAARGCGGNGCGSFSDRTQHVKLVSHHARIMDKIYKKRTNSFLYKTGRQYQNGVRHQAAFSIAPIHLFKTTTQLKMKFLVKRIYIINEQIDLNFKWNFLSIFAYNFFV